MSGLRIELSVDSLPGALAADAVGVDRIELCASSSEGGLTPSHGLIAEAVARCKTDIHVLVRPRGGDFLYTTSEIDAMVADVEHAVELGVAGVVSGVLTEDGTVHHSATQTLVAAAAGREFTFHRAIDVCADPFTALGVLGGFGVRRVLTSGAAPTAAVDLLARMVRWAPDGLAVMACGGIRPHNLVEIVRATGVQDVHAAPRRPQVGLPSHTAVDFGDRYELDAVVAAELRSIADGYPW
ncbi:MAG TPA: copper homeostasis protein CutC [Pseudonocardiaceae bacterium]|jgi:copper homeostasis protein